jgi:hypothetical protein
MRPSMRSECGDTSLARKRPLKSLKSISRIPINNLKPTTAEGLLRALKEESAPRADWVADVEGNSNHQHFHLL